MPDDTYDDGLVHGHTWATEPLAHLRAAVPSDDAIPAGGSMASPSDTYDDGLVHGHPWAAQAPEV